MKNFIFLLLVFLVQKAFAQEVLPFERLAEKHLLQDSTIASGHIGIAIFDAGTKKFVYKHQSDKYFIPASTTKLFTMYAGLRFLGDSLIGFYHKTAKDTLYLLPAGDPTFMHPDFKSQPAHQFLNGIGSKIVVLDEQSYPEPYGNGWAMDDMNESYMPQRSVFPVNGNLFSMEWIKNNQADSFPYALAMISSDFPAHSISKKIDVNAGNTVRRLAGKNDFEVSLNNKDRKITLEIPFEVSGMQSSFHLLKNALYHAPVMRKAVRQDKHQYQPFYSQATDTVLSLMMHRSDNFYAEQLLLMAGDRISGQLNQTAAIDQLLQNDLKGLPQKPRWVDGSGLSRYNLFTPEDEVYILQKLVDSFGSSRVKKILPTGGTGTMKKMFLDENEMVFAKTGSMSNNYCLSGILYTDKGRTLYFSVMLNNYIGSAATVKKGLEKYISAIRKNY